MPAWLAEENTLWQRRSRAQFPSTRSAVDQKLARRAGPGGIIIFGLILAAGMFYAGSHLISDLSVEKATSIRPFIMLGGALLIALGFEFVNGFHDTANAVATVMAP
jgi:phosphate/sulfate permease